MPFPILAALEAAQVVGSLFNHGGAGTVSGNVANAEMQGLNALQEQWQVDNYRQQIIHQQKMQQQTIAFDQMIDEKSEQMRETNALRDVQMEQRKADNQIAKKFIQSINE
ncbi:MAG: hypothetical protein M3Z14_01765 [Candidatus Eremiobacteraeota bacterium]|nr:hypothetical protein [Candidatus Eremiobacteraeota bacterium]